MMMVVVAVVVRGLGTFPVCPSLPYFLRLLCGSAPLCCCYATTAYLSYSASFFLSHF
ncbi:hypothetical protein IWX90DRAFT_429833 [Phyllosticta citrichinensis]|uniref:Secreted protein n=1 Tax=Phyllosticta citrichinensis TaxID=1130410 RepID=A0ABR1XVI9_9PEZI